VRADFVYGVHATDLALNAHWNYYVHNVHAYAWSDRILQGWSQGGSPATNCYVYNSSFYMLGQIGPYGERGFCANVGTAELGPDVVVHGNYSSAARPSELSDCPANGEGVTFAAYATDQAITAEAKRVLGAYPKPWNS
jgi:hypothetical protein